MKAILITLTILATSSLFWQCKNNKPATGGIEKQIRFGSGGGFTGKENTFGLTEAGQFYSVDITGKKTDIKTIKGRKTKAFFKTAQDLNLMGLDFMYPANTYSFIEVQEGDMVRRIVWGDAAHPVDPKIKELHDKLTEMLRLDGK